MASKIVQVPNVGNVEFPDSMSDDQISAAIKSNQGGGTQPAQAPQPGLLSRAWNAVATPVADLVSGGANITAKGLMQQATGDPFLYDSIRSSQSRGPSEADAKSPLKYAIKQGLGGAAVDTADTVAGITSPVSLATAGLGVASKGVGAASKLAQIGTKAAGTGFALKGAADVADAATNPDFTPAERAQKGFGGGAMMAGGRAGMMEQPAYGTLAKQFGEQAKAGFNKFAVPGTPSQLLTRATKPTVGLPDYEASLDRAIPSLFDQSQKAGKPINSVKTLADTADVVRNTEYGKYQSLMDQFRKPQGAGPYNPTQVDARPVADAQMASIPATDLFEKPNQQTVMQRGSHQVKVGDPGIVEKTKGVADLYRTDMPVEQADSIVRDTNAKLRAQWNKNAGDRNAALSNPETARLFAVDNGMRGQLYDTIKTGTGQDPTPIMQKYGDAVDIGDTAARRNTVFSRQQPIPLHEQISVAQALGDGKPLQAGMAKLFKNLNDSNWLTGEAFKRYADTTKPKVGGRFGYGSLSAAVAARR